MRQALEIFEETLAEDDPWTRIARENLQALREELEDEEESQ